MNKQIIPIVLFAVVCMLGSASTLAADGDQLFQFYCAQCHGPEGKGNGPNVTEDFATDPRDFTNTEEMEKLSDADIKNVVLDGGPALSKSELMPPWSKTLSDEEVDALTRRLREFCNCQGTGG